MEGVNRKVKWEVLLRAAKHTPHPAQRIRIADTRTMRQLILPVKEQLYEDATWKE